MSTFLIEYLLYILLLISYTLSEVNKMYEGNECEGEKNLVIAVMESAVSDMIRYRRNSILYRNAHRWVVSQTKSDYPFTFENVCQILNYDADYMRNGIITFVKKEKRKLLAKRKKDIALEEILNVIDDNK